MGSFFQLTISPWMVHFSYNLTISYNSYLAYEVVFSHHLRNSTGPKGTPLEYFRLWETFFEKKISPKGPPSIFWYFQTEWMLKNPKGSPIHQYFDILKSFCYFWALDMAPTWAVPGLFFNPVEMGMRILPIGGKFFERVLPLIFWHSDLKKIWLLFSFLKQNFNFSRRASVFSDIFRKKLKPKGFSQPNLRV